MLGFRQWSPEPPEQEQKTLRAATDSWVRHFRPVAALPGHAGCVNSIEFSSDGRILLSGSDDCTVCLYSVDERDQGGGFRQQAQISLQHLANIFHAMFLPNQPEVILSCGLDGRVVLTDVSRGPDAPQSFALSPRRSSPHDFASKIACHPSWYQTAFVGFTDGTIKGIDTRQPQITAQFNPHPYCVTSVNALAVHPSTPFTVAVGTNTHAVYWMDLRKVEHGGEGVGGGSRSKMNASAYTTVPGVTERTCSGIGGLSFSSRGGLLCVNFKDNDVFTVEWRGALAHSSLIPSSDHHRGAGEQPSSQGFFQRYSGRRNNKTMFKEAVFFRDDDYVVTGGDCGHLYFWRTQGGQLVHRVRGDGDIVNGVLAHDASPLLVCCGIDSTAKVLASDPTVRDKSAETEDALFGPSRMHDFEDENSEGSHTDGVDDDDDDDGEDETGGTLNSRLERMNSECVTLWTEDNHPDDSQDRARAGPLTFRFRLALHVATDVLDSFTSASVDELQHELASLHPFGLVQIAVTMRSIRRFAVDAPFDDDGGDIEAALLQGDDVVMHEDDDDGASSSLSTDSAAESFSEGSADPDLESMADGSGEDDEIAAAASEHVPEGVGQQHESALQRAMRLLEVFVGALRILHREARDEDTQQSLLSSHWYAPKLGVLRARDFVPLAATRFNALLIATEYLIIGTAPLFRFAGDHGGESDESYQRQSRWSRLACSVLMRRYHWELSLGNVGNAWSIAMCLERQPRFAALTGPLGSLVVRGRVVRLVPVSMQAYLSCVDQENANDSRIAELRERFRSRRLPQLLRVIRKYRCRRSRVPRVLRRAAGLLDSECGISIE